MIQQAFITEWRHAAPWSDDAQVEQDLVLSRVLVELFSYADIREAVAFRGGTALNKLHLDDPRRYSEDIDLVQLSPAPIGDLINPIQHRLEYLLGPAAVSIRKRSVRLLYRFESEIEPVVPLRLKIEIDTRDHEQILDLAPPVRGEERMVRGHGGCPHVSHRRTDGDQASRTLPAPKRARSVRPLAGVEQRPGRSGPTGHLLPQVPEAPRAFGIGEPWKGPITAEG